MKPGTKDAILDLEKKVEECENVFRTTFESTGNATIIIEEDTVISYANYDFQRLSGYSREELEGKISWTSFISEKDLPMMLEYHRNRRDDPNRAPRNYEFVFVDRWGTNRNIYMTINMVPGSRRSIGSFTDITDLKWLESQILRISELERHHIGNNLHDGLSPHLVGVQFLIKSLKHRARSGEPIQLELLDEINELISQALEQIRSISKGLMPVDIQPDGLIYALEELVRKTEKIYGILCDFSYNENFRLKENLTATHLYYIVQEAINNVIEHSQATEISILLETYGQFHTLSIRDNGIGIPDVAEIIKGLGLSSMKYRARIIGATFDILKNEAGGTTIFCRFRRDHPA